MKIVHPQLYDKLNLEDEKLWKQYFNNSTTNDGSGQFGGKKITTDVPVTISEFQKILISQVLRPDQMVGVMTKTMEKLMGKNVKCLNTVKHPFLTSLYHYHSIIK